MPSPEEMVRRGYDAAAERYAASRDQLENERHLRLFTQSLPPQAAVLDVGSGSGRPVAAFLVERGYAVTGIDFSPSSSRSRSSPRVTERHSSKGRMEAFEGHAGELNCHS